MHGTLHVWHEERPWQRGSMGWPALLLTLAYSSRALVACWGALGWQLPLPWHVVVQGLHVSLAGWRLAPAVCGAAGALRGNSSKLQTLALLLDWWVTTCLQSGGGSVAWALVGHRAAWQVGLATAGSCGNYFEPSGAAAMLGCVDCCGSRISSQTMPGLRTAGPPSRCCSTTAAAQAAARHGRPALPHARPWSLPGADSVDPSLGCIHRAHSSAAVAAAPAQSAALCCHLSPQPAGGTSARPAGRPCCRGAAASCWPAAAA